MVYVSSYTSPDAVIRLLSKADPSLTPSYAAAEYKDFYDLLMLDLIPQASQIISLETGRSFVPYRAAKTIYFRDMLDDRPTYRNRLILPDDLLVAIEVQWGGVVLQAADWRPLPSNALPTTEIGFKPGLGQPFTPSDYTSGITITGIWGYHVQASQMWVVVETLVGTVSSTQTTIAVSDAARYELLSYVKINDEYIQVVARTTTPTHTITVKRGVNGTTPATHIAPTLQTYAILPDIAYATSRLAAWAYQSRAMVGNIELPDGSMVVQQLPVDVRNIIRKYRRLQVGTA